MASVISGTNNENDELSDIESETGGIEVQC